MNYLRAGIWLSFYSGDSVCFFLRLIFGANVFVHINRVFSKPVSRYGYITVKRRLPEKHFCEDVYCINRFGFAEAQHHKFGAGFLDAQLYGHVICQRGGVGHNEVAKYGKPAG